MWQSVCARLLRWRSSLYCCLVSERVESRLVGGLQVVRGLRVGWWGLAGSERVESRLVGGLQVVRGLRVGWWGLAGSERVESRLVGACR